MIQRDRHNNYGQYSLYQQKDEEGYGNGTIDRSARKPRFPTRAPSLDNYLNGYKPNGIHGRNEMRLTVRNLQKLDKIRQHHQSVDSEPQMYNPPPNPAMNNEAFEIEFSLSIQKRESIKNWITDVHHSRENVNMNPEHEQKQQQQGPQTWIPHQKGYDSNKIQRKPLPREPANDRYSSTASGSAIDIEVHSLPRSFGSDGNKSPTGTLDRIDSPDQSSNQPQFEISGYIVSEDNQERPRQPATILEAVINDQYV
uniref:Uncharacterized protein n=2 Tax=Clytia hemisphaerica TaxID=252671 RepID=A0A7M5V8J2_9CNID